MFDKSDITLIARMVTSEVYKKYYAFFRCNGKRNYKSIFIYSKESMVKTKYEEIFCEELRLRRKLRHRNLVNIVDSFQDYDHIYLVYDNYDTVNMDIVAREYQFTRYEALVSIVAQVFSALFYLHSKSVALIALDPRSVEVLRRSGQVKINITNYNNEKMVEEFCREYTEYIMPFLPGNGETEPIHPTFYSVGVLIQQFVSVDVLPKYESEYRRYFQLLFILDELCNTERKLRILFEPNNFHYIRSNGLFQSTDWENIQPLAFSYLDSLQPCIHEYTNSTFLGDVYPTPKYYGDVDGYGTIFKLPRVRYVVADPRMLENHIYTAM